jgi:hypothetical protein
MNCLELRDETMIGSRHSHDSINAEWELCLNGDGLRSHRGFNSLQYWKRKPKRQDWREWCALCMCLLLLLQAPAVNEALISPNMLSVIVVIACLPWRLKVSYSLSTMTELSIHDMRKT